MIVFDVEATGLIEPGKPKPRIIEFAAAKIRVLEGSEGNIVVKEILQLESLINPGIPIPPEVIRITSITDDMVKDAPSLLAFLPKLQEFFLGETQLCAHNAPYDVGVLSEELARINKLNKFPWPSIHTCTLQAAEPMFGKLTSMTNIYKHATGKDLVGAHRAPNDVAALVECLPWYYKEGLL